MRLLSKYYEACSPEIFETGRRFILAARRKGCPRSFFSNMNRGDRRSIRNLERFDQSVFDLVFLFDIVSCVSNWIMIRALIVMKSESVKNPSALCASSLLVFIHHQLSAIRLLVVNELDTQARAACRPLREATDLLVLTHTDHELAASYVAAQDAKESNEFWYKNVRKDRMKKRNIRTVYGNLKNGQRTGEEILEYIDGEEEYISQAIHPSYIAGIIPIFSILGPGEDGEWGFLSKSVSERTLVFSCFVCVTAFIYYMLNSDMPEGISIEEIESLGDNEKEIKESMVTLLLCVASALTHMQTVEEARQHSAVRV